jgi:hypothetical protein
MGEVSFDGCDPIEILRCSLDFSDLPIARPHPGDGGQGRERALGLLAGNAATRNRRLRR